ncbi:MAG TPA: sigma-70 family RNA polymerase sigma factor [Streptosporangiaceae bacterium]|nr:sigma-70 family RNA polymerase sigma factor [Streptosporangiaceae bacterium]
MESDEIGVLVRAAAGGDSAAWKAIVEHFSGLVWAITRGYRLGPPDAADVFQTTWLRLAEHLDRIASPERLGAWLATTARRESLRIARAAARTTPAHDGTLVGLGHVDDHSPEQAVLDAEQAMLDSERARQLWRAFRELSDRCQQLLRVLMASPPPSYAEVGAALGMPVGSIGPSRARCLDRLRQMLTGKVSARLLCTHRYEKQRLESIGV